MTIDFGANYLHPKFRIEFRNQTPPVDEIKNILLRSSLSTKATLQKSNHEQDHA